VPNQQQRSIVNLSQILGSVGKDLSTATKAEKQIAVLIHAPCEARVKQFIKCDPTFHRIDAHFPGVEVRNLREKLVLRNPPVRNVVSVYYNPSTPYSVSNDTNAGDVELVENTDFAVSWTSQDATSGGLRLSNSAMLIRLGSLWYSEPGCVRVVYDAGYEVDEFLGYGGAGTERAAVIQSATLRYCSMAFTNFINQRGTTNAIGLTLPAGSLTSEKFQDYSYTIDAGSAASRSGFRYEIPPEVRAMLAECVDKWAGGAI
jgi:hypothetical protein